MTAYARALRNLVETDRPRGNDTKLDLEARLVSWFASTPEISRHRPYSMVEIETALSSQGRYLGPVLFKLGWQRRRKWTGCGQYSRYWEPPSAHKSRN